MQGENPCPPCTNLYKGDFIVDKTLVIGRLLQLPELIERAEQDVIEIHENLTAAKEALDELEAMLILGQSSIKIDGKNAEQRQAQVFQATVDERSVLATDERALAVKRAELSRLKNELKAYSVVASLMAGEAV